MRYSRSKPTNRLVQLFLGVVVWGFAPTLASAADLDPALTDALVEQALREMQVPGAAVTVVRGDRVIYMKGFGVRSLGGNEPVTPQTLFPIASCSKAFTATLVAMLVEQGKLQWDDKVRDHLEYFRLSDELADREVTLRDLLCHRTGMPRHDLLWAGLTRDTHDLIRRWGLARPSTSFRSTWEYTNVPFTIAGLIAARYNQSDWAGTLQKRIFEPLEMWHSTGRQEIARLYPDRVTPHYFTFGKQIVPVREDEVEHVGGAGGIYSTVEDMSRWLRFQLNGGIYNGRRLLSERHLRETHTPQMLFRPEGIWSYYFPPAVTRFTTYGLGWFVHDYRGIVCVSHGGTLTGIRAYCLLIPEAKIGICVLANLRPSLFAEAVTRLLVDRLLGLAPIDWIKICKEHMAHFDFQNAIALQKRLKARKANTRPTLPLPDYCGQYAQRAYGTAVVFLQDDQLHLRWGRYTFRLEHYHYDTFTAIPVEPRQEVVSFDRSIFEAQFHLRSNGEVATLTLFGQDFQRRKGP
ncbi:MAG: serine hydrolase, partial [Gemmataceae bacterium]|nr:serine hydrolase [Gemmataceae bacterium]